MDSVERALTNVGKRQSPEAELNFPFAFYPSDRDKPRESIRKNGTTAELMSAEEVFGGAFFGLEGKMQPKWESMA